MLKAVAESLPTGSGQDLLPVAIAAMPISARERKIAFGLITVLALIDVMVAPFANVRLARFVGFIPAIQTVMCAIGCELAFLRTTLFGYDVVSRSYRKRDRASCGRELFKI